MVKVVFLLKFLPDKDPDEVRRWWRTDHGALALKTPGLKRYVQNHFVAPVDEEHAEAGMPYHGMVEVWFDDHDAYEAAMASPEWKALEEDGYVGFQMDSLQGGFVTEHIMRWEGLPEGRIYTSAGAIPEA